MKRVFLILGSVSLLLLGAAGAVAAVTPDKIARHDEFSFSFIDTESCPGLEIQSDLEAKRNRTDYFDQDGTLVRTVINVQYRITFTNLADPTLAARTPGHRHIVLDYVNNTFTDTGVYRNVTVPGAGNVLHVSGRVLAALDHDEILAMSGPHEDFLGDFCAALGG